MNWKCLLDPEVNAHAQDTYWELFVARVKAEYNFYVDIKLQLHPVHDLALDTELLSKSYHF